MQDNEKFRFIPYRRQDIVDICLTEPKLENDAEAFRQLSYMLDQIFHFEFHQVIEALKSAYADIDPDADTRRPGFDVSENTQSFISLLDGLLEKANYERVTESDLNRALSESSLFKIRLHVDFEIDDALHKLLALGLVEKSGGSLIAVSIEAGIRILDQRWDNYFVPGY